MPRALAAPFGFLLGMKAAGPGTVSAAWWIFLCERTAAAIGGLVAQGAVSASTAAGLSKVKQA